MSVPPASSDIVPPASIEEQATRTAARKVAVLIGLDRYDDKRIPQLTNAVSDSVAVGQALSVQLGYETIVLENPGKQAVIAALNRLVEQTSANDSVIVYFAGHGEMVERTGLGYWIPADARADDPAGWISNADVSRALSRMRSRQIAVFADSCYSGLFAREAALAEQDRSVRLEDYRQRRAVTVMSSGGDEPVADTGKEGHSVFAWNLLQQLKGLQGWQPGARLFAEVRTAVERELPQSPVYGASLTAGHEQGADFLFQRPGASDATP